MAFNHTELNAIATGFLLVAGTALQLELHRKRSAAPDATRHRIAELECALFALMIWGIGTALFYLANPNGAASNAELLILDFSSIALLFAAVLLGWGFEGLKRLIGEGRWRIGAGCVLILMAWEIAMPSNVRDSTWHTLLMLVPSQFLSIFAFLLLSFAVMRRFSRAGLPFAISCALYGLLHLPAYPVVFGEQMFPAEVRLAAFEALAAGKVVLLFAGLMTVAVRVLRRCQARRVRQELLLSATLLGSLATLASLVPAFGRQIESRSQRPSCIVETEAGCACTSETRVPADVMTEGWSHDDSSPDR